MESDLRAKNATKRLSMLLLALFLPLASCATYRSVKDYPATDLSALRPGMTPLEVEAVVGDISVINDQLAVARYNRGYDDELNRVWAPVWLGVEVLSLGIMTLAEHCVTTCQKGQLHLHFDHSKRLVRVTEHFLSNMEIGDCTLRSQSSTCSTTRAHKRPSTLPQSLRGKGS